MRQSWPIFSLLLAGLLALFVTGAAAAAEPGVSTFVVVLAEPVPGDPASALPDQMALAEPLDALQALGAVRAYTPYLGINAIVVTGNDTARQFLAAWPTVVEVWPYDADTAQGRSLAEAAAASLAAPAAGTAHIQGIVTGPDAATPLVGIEVKAYRYNNVLWVWVGTASTTADGSYDIPDLPAGAYRVGFSDPAGNYMPEFYDNKADLNSGTPFNLAEGQIKTGISASLALAGAIAGTVTRGADGAPIASISVGAWRFYDAAWHLQGTDTTGADGQYRIGGLPAGMYRIEFKDLLLRYTGEWYFNVPTRDMASDIAVTAGQTRTGVDADLNGSGTVKGTVTGPDGLTPAAGIEVDLYQYNTLYTSWDWGGGAVTAADGNYSTVALAGTYRVKFSDPLAQPYFITEYYNDKPDISSGNNVVVTDGGTVTANASLALYALPPTPVVTLTRNGANADLTWPAITQDTAGKPVTIQRYEVWYSAAAYFAIGDAGATRVNRSVPNYTDTGTLSTPGGRFYLVRALTDRGGYSPASNKTAKFTFALTPGGP